MKRTRPGCVLFLIDRSWSMAEPCGPGTSQTLAEGVAGAVNKLLHELIVRSIADPGEGPRNYYDVGVIGYGQSAYGDDEAVESGFGGVLAGRELVSIAELAANPMRIDQVELTGRHHDGRTVAAPVWVDPEAGFSTPMCGAIELAGSWLSRWVADHPDSFPPIVINITDGIVTDRGSDGSGLSEWARRLRSLGTEDGNVLLFNVFLTAGTARPIFFPSTPSGLPQPAGTDLFETASPLPASMVEVARSAGFPAEPGARGMVFNADLSALVSFLRIGTERLDRFVDAARA
ncbi:MAG: VWA domain-containing protein [Actinomycetota bacterium]